jgi:hypothetical protein
VATTGMQFTANNDCMPSAFDVSQTYFLLELAGLLNETKLILRDAFIWTGKYE